MIQSGGRCAARRRTGGICMGDNYFLLTKLLSEDKRKVITSITAHIEHGKKRVGIQQIAVENYLSTGEHRFALSEKQARRRG